MRMRYHARSFMKKGRKPPQNLICGSIWEEAMGFRGSCFTITDPAEAGKTRLNSCPDLKGCCTVTVIPHMEGLKMWFWYAAWHTAAGSFMKLSRQDVGKSGSFWISIQKRNWKSLLPAEKGVAFCNRLFFLERCYKELPAEERKQKRQEKEPEIWNEFWSWLGSLNPTGGSKLEKAVNYAFNHKETLMNYLLDGRRHKAADAVEWIHKGKLFRNNRYRKNTAGKSRGPSYLRSHGSRTRVVIHRLQSNRRIEE